MLLIQDKGAAGARTTSGTGEERKKAREREEGGKRREEVGEGEDLASLSRPRRKLMKKCVDNQMQGPDASTRLASNQAKKQAVKQSSCGNLPTEQIRPG